MSSQFYVHNLLKSYLMKIPNLAFGMLFLSPHKAWNLQTIFGEKWVSYSFRSPRKLFIFVSTWLVNNEINIHLDQKFHFSYFQKHCLSPLKSMHFDFHMVYLLEFCCVECCIHYIDTLPSCNMHLTLCIVRPVITP